VIGSAGRKLRGCHVQDALARSFGDHVQESQQILCRIPEAHAAANARFEVGGRARHIEGDHTLVGVPDVDHAVGVFIRAGDLELAQKLFPIRFEAVERLFHFGGVQVFCDHRFDRAFVDGLAAGRVKFLVYRVFLIAQHKDHRSGFTGGQVHLDVMRADGLPAVRDGIG